MLEINKEKNAYVTLVALGLLVVILFGRIFFLQVIKGKDYQTLSRSVRARVIPTIAPRGFIYDRYGHVLAESKIIYDLYLLPYQVKNFPKPFDFLDRIGIDSSVAKRKFQKKAYLPYEPILLKKNINLRTISYVEENKDSLDSLLISSRIVRNYPYGELASHVLGYVGEIDANELERLKNYGYKIGDIVGMAGVERYYDHFLKGINGGQPLEVDPLGNPIKKMGSMDPIPGSNIYLTIDMELQRHVERVFGNHKGSVVIIDPRSGEVLTMLSKPSYNPNFFTDILTTKEWNTILSKEHPLHNRALTGFPPGSIFKIITGMAALEDKKFNAKKKYLCKGFLRLGGRRFACWFKPGHGKMDFAHGFLNSCNVVFYNLGLFLGPDKIADAAASFGLGLPTGIDLPFESSGFIPTEKWKKRKYKKGWYPGDSLNMAIGQGYILTTPLQMVSAVSALANDTNLLLKPFLVKKVVSADDQELLFNQRELLSRLPFKKKNIDQIKLLMRDVVQKGTGRRSRISSYQICGKTGTAEHGHKKKTHAWFLSFAPYESPEIAMVVFVESGGFGGDVAAGISQQIYLWWIKNRSKYASKI